MPVARIDRAAARPPTVRVPARDCLGVHQRAVVAALDELLEHIAGIELGIEPLLVGIRQAVGFQSVDQCRLQLASPRLQLRRVVRQVIALLSTWSRASDINGVPKGAGSRAVIAFRASPARSGHTMFGAVGWNSGSGFVVRTAWLYGAHGPSFVGTMIKLEDLRPTVDVVDDQHGQPTWTVDVARQVIALVHSTAAPGEPAAPLLSGVG